MSSRNKNRVFLEPDKSILERQLLIQDKKEFEELSSLFPKNEEDTSDIPWVAVTPVQGFCAKCHTVKRDKIFINVCYTASIPKAEDISNEKLMRIWNFDEVTDYKIPMSIGNLHLEVDKSGNTCSAYDIAVNPFVFEKITTNALYQNFFMTVSLEAIQNKFSIQIDSSKEPAYVILKNRKTMGTLQQHRVQQRPVKRTPSKLIDEIKTTNKVNTLIHRLKADKTPMIVQPSLKIVKRPVKNPEYLLATLEVDVVTSNDLYLQVGEDRVLLLNPLKNEKLLDFFLPYKIDCTTVESTFFKDTKVLEIKMPLKNEKESCDDNS